MQSNNNSQILLDYAIRYKNKNFSIIPLQTKSKIPAVDTWMPYTTYIASTEEINQWFSASDYNIGLVTGSISGVFAIDIDDKEAYDYFIDKITQIAEDDDSHLKKSIKDTMKIVTGSGNTNFIFKFDPNEFPEGDKIPNTLFWKSPIEKEHCEIRLIGEGKYIVVPPSIHQNNQKYCLVNGINPIFLTRKQIQKIIDLFSKAGSSRNENTTKSISQITEILKPHYSNGRRNDLVLYLSGWLRKLGIPLEVAEEIITELAKEDEEKSNRVRTLYETYKKQDLDKIAGYSGILESLSYDCSEDDAKEKLTTVKEIIDKKFETNKNNKTEKEEEIDILSLIKEDYCVALFVDQFNKSYIAIKIKDHVEILGLDSQRFKNWLYRFIYENTGELKSEQVENTLKVLKSEAEFNENRKKLELRVAKPAATDNDDYAFYYDLTNSNWSTVKITSQGWSIENTPPILFRRYSNHLPQVIPIRILENNNKNEYNVLDKFVNLLNIKDDDNRLLLKCYIISLFIPGIAKPILMLHGEQGSAKSTLQELIKMLVDPSIVRTLTFPRDINELVQQLSHNYVAYFDNVSVIKEWISDTLCRGSTGSGFSKRQLYTDDDDIIYNFKRCIGINGINLGATKADLLDRGIIIQLERIPKERRRKLEDIWKEFESLRPQLLGYIFDILVKVLQIKQKSGIIIPNGLNRMADFEEYAEIISRCMGYPEGEFLRVYQDNIGVQIDEAIQASPLSMALVELMDNGKEDNDELINTATELSVKLNEIAETKLKIDIKKISSWPKSPNQLSRRLNEIKTNLREKGIVIESYKDEKGNRKIKIRKVSSISPYRQKVENQEQSLDKSLDDTLNDTTNISSNNNEENHAQKAGFGRYGDMDDTIHSKIEAGLFTNPLISKSDLTLEDYPYEPDIINNISRGNGSDHWYCNRCTKRGDKWEMMKHHCKHKTKLDSNTAGGGPNK